jgi:cytidylate kinase
MTKRDSNDRNRVVAPAVPASDAVILDNSGFTEEQTLERAVEIIRNKVKD